MRLEFTDQEQAFREEVRAFLRDKLTPDISGKVLNGYELGREEHVMWQRRLHDRGWGGMGWPKQFGGPGWNSVQQYIFDEESALAGAPRVIPFGTKMVAPVIMAFGSPAQQQRFLPPISSGEEWWCQGYSEPGAGSDLASLRTTAVADGDEFVLNGQKTWNSLGHFADWCQLYVRTDPTVPKHKGISCLLVDLRTPGIERRPVRTNTGEEPFAELFFTDARVPASSLLGPLHQGWTVAMTTLSFERAGVARLHLGLAKKLDKLLAEPGAADGLTDPRIRHRVAGVYADIACMRWMTTRSLAQERQGQPSGTAGSLAKLAWGRIEQRLAELAIDLLGPSALTGGWAYNLAAARQTTIAGGTTEINLNILGEMGLGLPREPKPA